MGLYWRSGVLVDDQEAGSLIKRLLLDCNDDASDNPSSSSNRGPMPPREPPPEWLLAKHIFGDEMDVDFGE